MTNHCSPIVLDAMFKALADQFDRPTVYVEYKVRTTERGVTTSRTWYGRKIKTPWASTVERYVPVGFCHHRLSTEFKRTIVVDVPEHEFDITGTILGAAVSARKDGPVLFETDWVGNTSLVTPGSKVKVPAGLVLSMP